MERRRFGRSGLDMSLLTFGCGAVGGLMTAGRAEDQDRAVAWARDNGINHFDTAASYGNGASEENLGRALAGNRDDIIVSTKVGLAGVELDDVAGAIRTSLDASLTRLKLDHVDIFQLHNRLGTAEGDARLPAQRVIDEVVPAFLTLRDEGKLRFIGFTANGNTDDIHTLIASDYFDSAQIFFNMLVPSAGEAVPVGYPAQDYRQLLAAADRHGVGSIGVRVLAGGALSGSEARHPLGMAVVDPIGSDTDYATDVKRARAFSPLVEAAGAGDLPELAVRYAISNPTLCTTEIGIATLEELQKAAAAVNKGPLSEDVLTEIRNIQSGFASAAA